MLLKISFVKDFWSVVCSVLNLTFLQIITFSHFEFERYLGFFLVLNVKLNFCTKFVLHYM